MRKLYFLLVLFLSCITDLMAQDAAEEPEFKITRVPDQWQQESAVILAQKLDYAYVRKTMASAMTIKEYVHKRIKLLDKSALEKFSEFYYVTYGKRTEISYSIIKASGKVELVDLSKAIEVNKDVDNIYRPIFLSSNTVYIKIAIPNLELGDIVD